MAQVCVSCPSCQATLTLNHPWAPGVGARCPRCQFEFALPDAASFAAPRSGPLDSPLGPPSGRYAAALGLDQQDRSPGGYSQPAEDPPTSSSKPLLVVLAIFGALLGTAIVAIMILATKGGPNAQQPIAQQPSAQQPFANQPPGAQAPLAPAAAGQPPVAQTAGQASSYSTPAAFGSTPVGQAVAAPANSSVLAYRWNPGEDYVYYFNIQADVAGAPDASSGSVSLKASSQGATESARPPEIQHGSGTGFLVTSDGYLVTCAHVVENATKIDVVVGPQTLPGQVIALDKPHDLAIVRVQAANLPIVPLANSDAVQLAQEVRAVGYPLSNVLGESVKITRGTVSGMVNSEGRRLFQVDASINPGNSGGPVVNELGHVVGVASAKLAGEDIDGVGFAVISNDVQALLSAHRVPFQAAQPGVRLDGPELARRVTPAVVMLKVAIAAGGVGRRQALEFHGSVSSTNQRTMPSGRRINTPNFPQFDRGKLVLTEYGELVEVTGEAQLPYLLGGLGPLTIEPLSASGERSWRSERVVALTQTIEEESPSGMSFRFRRPRGFRSPFASQTKVVITPAMETMQYELLASSGQSWQIKKRYQFKTLGSQGGQAPFEVNGEGVLTFNQPGGFAEKLEYRANVLRNSGNVSVTTPVTLNWHRATAAELADAQRRAAAAEANRKAEEARAAAPMTNEELEQALADLAPAQTDFFRRHKALEALQKRQPVDAQRARVIGAASALTTDSNSSIREDAVRVMGAWGVKDTVPQLVSFLDRFDQGLRRAAIDGLGKIKDDSAAAALAPLLANQSDQHNAARALEAIGEIAEPAVIPMLTHGDQHVRFEACKLLGKIGGKDSVAAIKKLLLREQDGLVKLGAEGALRDLGKKGL